MTTRALTLAIRLLTASAALATLGAEAGCQCPEPWSDQAVAETGLRGDLNAVAVEPGGRYLIVSAEGEVARLAGGHGGIAEPAAAILLELDLPLFAVLASNEGQLWIAGAEGTLMSSLDGGESWFVELLDTDAALRDLALVRRGDRRLLVVVGDGVLGIKDLDSQQWSTPAAPEGGWGELRAVFDDGERIFAVGAGGVAWSSAGPGEPWTREQTGLGSSDINDGGTLGSYAGYVAVVGDGGKLAVREAGGWTRISTGMSDDLVAWSRGAFLTRNGRIFELWGDELEEIAGPLAEINRGLQRGNGGMVAIGDDGQVRNFGMIECIGGRPLVVDGRPRVAALVDGTGWSEAGSESERPALDDEARAQLAAAWAHDALYEHASVASFVGFARDLLELGAPPELIADATRAAADEVVHARLCFELARRYGARELGAGALELGPGSGAAVDPVALAIATFEDGCVNESLAACEAAAAAAACRDREVRAVLERIAEDERRHAVLAWRCLGWLLRREGERVAGALRRHLGRRPVPGVAAPGRALEVGVAHGRLGARERALVHRRAYLESVVPLAQQMFGAEPAHSSTT